MENVSSRKGLYGFEFRDVDRRRTDPEDRKTYDAKAMWQRSHEVVNLAAKGMKQVDIARILDITKETVSNILNSELGMQKLSDVREERDIEAKKVTKRIKELTEKALDVYAEIFEDKGKLFPIEMKKKTADTVALELAGLRAPTRIQSASFSMVATAEEIEEFKERGIKAAQESGLIVDAEIKEITDA